MPRSRFVGAVASSAVQRATCSSTREDSSTCARCAAFIKSGSSACSTSCCSVRGVVAMHRLTARAVARRMVSTARMVFVVQTRVCSDEVAMTSFVYAARCGRSDVIRARRGDIQTAAMCACDA